MLNWIKFIAIFLLALGITITVIVFYHAQQPFKTVEDRAIATVKKEQVLKTVDRAEVYHGTVPFVTVYGTDQEGEKRAVFVDSTSFQIRSDVVLSEGIQRQEAIQTVQKELPIDELLHARLGFEEEYPVWEVAFKSKNGKLNYVYVFFENGEWWKRILNL